MLYNIHCITSAQLLLVWRRALGQPIMPAPAANRLLLAEWCAGYILAHHQRTHHQLLHPLGTYASAGHMCGAADFLGHARWVGS